MNTNYNKDNKEMEKHDTPSEGGQDNKSSSQSEPKKDDAGAMKNKDREMADEKPAGSK